MHVVEPYKSVSLAQTEAFLLSYCVEHKPPEIEQNDIGERRDQSLTQAYNLQVVQV